MQKTQNIVNDIQEGYDALRICDDYFSYLGSKYPKETDSLDSKLFKALMSYQFTPRDVWRPFSPLYASIDGRSALPEDLSEEDIARLEECYVEIKDPELKARIADVLWLKKRDVKYAHDAIDSYVLSAKNLRGGELWIYTMDRIERALKLSVSLGRGFIQDRDNVLAYIKSVFEEFDLEKETFLPLRLTELLLEVGHKEIDGCISGLETSIQFFEKQKDIHVLNEYLECLAVCLEKKGDKAGANNKRALMAENHVRLQESEGSSIAKTHNIEAAIEIYRRIGGGMAKARIEELHKDLREVQKGIPEELMTVETPIDLSDMVEASRVHVSNHEKEKALFRFCFVAQPTDVKEAFNGVERETKEFIFTRLVKARGVDAEGKTVSHRPGILDNDSKSREDNLYPYLVEHLAFHWHIKVEGHIMPALHQIMIEHCIEERDIEALVKNHPLIRPGHEYMFAQGILHGLRSQFEMAATILIPEFEDSLRYVFTNRGKITSSIEDDFTQEERSTNTFFKNYHTDLKEVFGEDTYYELRALLVKDENGHGYNLRNSIAHGLMTRGEFYSSSVVYFWWLLFRFTCMPAIRARKKKDS